MTASCRSESAGTGPGLSTSSSESALASNNRLSISCEVRFDSRKAISIEFGMASFSTHTLFRGRLDQGQRSAQLDGPKVRLCCH
jgi:hypothetical protein